MGDKKKKRKSVEETTEEPVEKGEEEKGEEEEGTEESEEPAQVDEDYQKEFKVLGHKDFDEVKKIRVVSSWIKHAQEFPSDVRSHTSPLSDITGLPETFTGSVNKELKHWFPVQRAVIPSLLQDIIHPPALRRRDIAISAPTGSGKTLCYVLPLLACIERPAACISSLVVVPVQALVRQILSEFERFNAIGAKVVGLSGSEPYEKERKRLVNARGNVEADIIVATPSRLVEHFLDPSGNMDLSRLRFIVADEADRMLNVRQEWLEMVEDECAALGACSSLMDFAVRRGAPQKILLSATLSRDVEHLEKWRLHRPRLFRASAEAAEQVDTTAECVLPSGLSHVVIESPLRFHPLVLFDDILTSGAQRVLVFTNHRESSVRLCRLLCHLAGDSFRIEHLTADLHGRRRAKVLERFRKGAVRVLISSDNLSRGVDVEAIDCVVNYDLPQATTLFVHRAGRTARAGADGRLVSIAEKQPKRLFVKLLKKGNLWKDAKEEIKGEEELKDRLDEYKRALDKMREEVEREKKTWERKGDRGGGQGGGNRGGQRGGKRRFSERSKGGVESKKSKKN